MRYFDKNGEEILAGMTIRHDDGEEELVYACSNEFDDHDLGVNASNEAYMRNHHIPEWRREFYPLSSFCMREWTIVHENA